jgi:GTPase SAR1 family protein
LRTVLEGHTDVVTCVEFSHDGRLLYSIGGDLMLRCWQADTWQCVSRIDISGTAIDRKSYFLGDRGRYFVGGLAANPTRRGLARRTYAQGVELFDMAIDQVPTSAATPSPTYVNAKVVLLGDTGVGKSGLGLVLSSQPYRPTDSTHARQVWTFDVRKIKLPGGSTETREILLWDLAGQPGYRLIHQLHLAEAAAALVVFDARNEGDPFVGVRYWMRALRQTLRQYRNAGRPNEAPTPAILVAARVDRGGIPVSKQRIAALCDELGVMTYLETSAKEGWGISELAEAIRHAIDWARLPRSVSTELFETIKRFLIDEKGTDRVLGSVEDLFRHFIRRRPERAVDDRLRASFETCVRLIEGRDLVRRLSFGGFVLLRPELLDAYASALIDAARGQPDGLGYISEDDALAGRFPIPEHARLPGQAEERLLLIATVEELLRHDLVLREPTDDGVDLVFPSQFTHDRPDAPDPATSDVVFWFDGAVKTIYATLAVRLSHVAAYRRAEMWRNASTYQARVGGTCGLRVREVDEGRGELTLFFDEAASEETRFLFEDYVHAHLLTRALPGSALRERVFTCASCGYRLPADLVRRRQSRGDTSMRCPDCELVRISLLDRENRLGPASMQSVRQMNASADAGRDRAAATATIRGKEVAGDYDLFLSYNSKDRAAITEIAERLRTEGVLPWFDTSDIAPGQRWPDELERQIRTVRAGAVFIGPHGLGPWQEMEQQAFVNEHARREFRVIPVLLPGIPDGIELPVFLAQWHAVDFRLAKPDPFDRLLWAVTGERWRDAEPS